MSKKPSYTYIYSFILTGHTMAKAKSGPVERANNHCQPKVGITTKARATSKHAPKAQKHCKFKIHKNHCNLIVL